MDELQAEIAVEDELREQLEWHKSELARCKSKVAVLAEMTTELEAAAVTCSCGVSERRQQHTPRRRLPGWRADSPRARGCTPGQQRQRTQTARTAAPPVGAAGAQQWTCSGWMRPLRLCGSGLAAG